MNTHIMCEYTQLYTYIYIYIYICMRIAKVYLYNYIYIYILYICRGALYSGTPPAEPGILSGRTLLSRTELN